MNNLKQIRDLYGATQEEIASAIGVNRVTVVNWENGNSTASSANQEKLSLYYGIGPEYFYDRELDAPAQEQIIRTAEKERSVSAESEGRRRKHEEFHNVLENLSFKDAMQRYMISMKLLLATADNADLGSLETASLINKKMGQRLDAIINLRHEELRSKEPTLFDLLERLENEQ